MTHIWRLEWFGIGKETTRGTAVAPAFWIPHTEASFQNRKEEVIDESSFWTWLNSANSEKTKEYADGNIKWILASNWCWYLFEAILGSGVSAATTWWGGAYQHDFTLTDTNTKPSFTIVKKTPLDTKAYTLGMLSSLTMSANVGEAVFLDVNIMAKVGVNTTATKAYAVDNKLYAKHLKVKIADDIAGLDWASGSCFENIELSLTQDLENEFCFNSGVGIGDIFNKAFWATGTIGRIKQDNTFEWFALSDPTTYKAMRIEIIDTGVTIGTSDNPSVIIDLARVSFGIPEDDAGLDEIVRETIPFTVHQDIANWENIDIKVINTLSAY